MNVLGIDGCRGGWLVVQKDSGEITCTIHRRLSEIELVQSVDRVFIDMPIGLASSEHPRTIETTMRHVLASHQKSSVFTPPVRDAVRCTDYDQAKLVNISQTGKSISIQSWNIVHKIRELDDLIASNPGAYLHIYEAHPEICFNRLNGQSTQFKKKSAAGQTERIEILSNYINKPEKLVHETLQRSTRAQVAMDDILDALCLCISAGIGIDRTPEVISDQHAFDELGIPIRVAYPSA